MDAGELDEAAIAALIRHLRDAAFADRARRIAAYVGGIDGAAQRRGADRPGAAPAAARPERQPGALGRISRAGGAHPFRRRVHRASDLRAARRRRPRPGRDRLRRPVAVSGSHRPPPITLRGGVRPGRSRPSPTAATRSTGSTPRCSRSRAHAWPDRWTELDPRPVILSSWVGYDTDGRTDIGWWDTLRLRLEMKRLQLAGCTRRSPRCRRRNRWRNASRWRSTRWPRSSRSAPTRPTRRGRRLRAGAGRAAGRGADLAAAVAAAVRAGASPRPRTTTRGWRFAPRAPGWCRMAWRWRTRIRG